MQTFLRRSFRACRVGARVVVAALALAGASLGHAQSEDRPISTGGKTVGIAPGNDDGKPAADRRLATPDAKPVPKDALRGGGPSALIFTIDVRWLGATSYRIERDVTSPIERAVKTLPGVKEVHSSSIGSRAQTLVYFDVKEDASKQATAIRNRLDQIKTRLPHTASQPLIGWRRDPPI